MTLVEGGGQHRVVPLPAPSLVPACALFVTDRGQQKGQFEKPHGYTISPSIPIPIHMALVRASCLES